MVTVTEVKNIRSDINVTGTLKDKGEPRTVNTKYGETKVCDFELTDDTGAVKLSLWGEEIDAFNNGDKVSIQGGYTTTFKNTVQLNVPKKNGKISKIS